MGKKKSRVSFRELSRIRGTRKVVIKIITVRKIRKGRIIGNEEPK